MHQLRAYAALALAICFCTASAARTPAGARAVGTIVATNWPYLPGSTIQIHVDGFLPPYRTVAIGPGTLGPDGWYTIPNDVAPARTTIVVGNAQGLAARELRIAAPPNADESLLAVASYDDGIVFHDADTFAILGVLAIAGAPGDVAIDRRGRVITIDTQGTDVTIAPLAPWGVTHASGVPLGDEVAVDSVTDAIFVTNRGAGEAGALTRVASDGAVTHVPTGDTAEGLAIDEQRQIVYVANVNDGTVTAVDARSMRVVRHFQAVARVFSLALSPDGRRLYASSNQSSSSLFAAPGSVVGIALDRRVPRVVVRSAPLTFPLGVVLDSTSNTLFVTDEAADTVDVLDATTLRAKHAPLPTCRTPWTPALDAHSHRLYIPCARADEIDVFDTRTLHRLDGAPFATGSYPLAVTVWHPQIASKAAPSR
jgi:DNA-binding beta-propeller fold protein YncE